MAEFLNLRSHADSDPIRNFRFLVTFIPLVASTGAYKFTQNPSLGFMTVQGLAAQTEAIPYREGGFNTTPHQLPGQQAFSPVTLQRGVVLGNNGLGGWDWFRSLYDPSGTGSSNEDVTKDFRFRVKIRVLKYPASHNRTLAQNAGDSSNVGAAGSQVAVTFNLINAWPTNIAYSDLNASDNAVLVEQMTLVHEGLYPEAASTSAYSIDGAGGQPVTTGRAVVDPFA